MAIKLFEKHKFQKKIDTGVDPLSQKHTKLDPLKIHTKVDPLSRNFTRGHDGLFNTKHPLGTFGKIKRR